MKDEANLDLSKNTYPFYLIIVFLGFFSDNDIHNPPEIRRVSTFTIN